MPLSKVYSNSMVAKTLAKENLLHQPLPDNFDENLYKTSNEKSHKNECNNTTAVGCKCYGVPGPTQCSKLKVYRPKTAHPLQNEDARSNASDRCHRDSVKADKKEYYSDIDYALCWDLCPPGHPGLKKSTHIDGSNGSLAPAVFSLVPSRDPSPCLYEARRDGLHSPPPPRALSAKCCPKNNHEARRVAKASEWVETTTPLNTINPSAMMTIVKKPEPQENYFPNKQNREQTPFVQKQRCSSCTSNRSLGNNQKEEPPKPWKNEEYLRSKYPEQKRILNKEEMIEQRLKQRNIHSSSPNLAVHRPEHPNANIHREQLNQNKYSTQNYTSHNNAEEIPHHDLHDIHHIHDKHSNGQQISPNGRPKDGTKVCKDPVCPRLLRSRDSSISSNSRKTFSPPKLKNHYIKKSYSIPTLLPPFTLWPGTTGQDYPEHWRLASVYQHSYKPIEMRKRNLLQCIYQ